MGLDDFGLVLGRVWNRIWFWVSLGGKVGSATSELISPPPVVKLGYLQICTSKSGQGKSHSGSFGRFTNRRLPTSLDRLSR